MQKSFHFAFSAEEVTYLCHESEGSWIMREANQWDFPINEISESDISNLKNIHQFSLGFKTAQESATCAEILNKKFAKKICAYPNACSLDITPFGISKKQGLDCLIEKMNWHDSEIYVIGDEVNDLPMISAFKGYTVNTARDFIKSQAQKVFSDVGEMLKFFL